MKNKDISTYNEQSEKHGYWEWYYKNGQLWDKGNYINGKRHGYWEFYYRNGQLKSKTYYI